MINQYLKVEEISFEKVEYDKSLFDSIFERGVAIPIKVKQSDNGYICLDGNKRLSAIEDINLQGNKTISKVLVMIVNDHSNAGSKFWGPRNQH